MNGRWILTGGVQFAGARWSIHNVRALLQKLKYFTKNTEFEGIRRFITVLSRAHRWSLFWSTWIQSMPCFFTFVLAYFPYWKKIIKLGLWAHLAVWLSVYPPPHQLLNSSTSLYGTWYIYHAPEPISTAYFINPSHQSACLYAYPPIVARQRLGKSVPRKRRIVGDVLYAVRVVSKKSRRLGLPRIFHIGTNVRVRVFNAGLMARSQFSSGRSCDRPTRSRFSTVLEQMLS
jgi:hypothetical protein